MEIEITRMLYLNKTVTPIVEGALGMNKKNFDADIKKMPRMSGIN